MKLSGAFPSVLFFIADMVPTPAEAKEALRYGPNTKLRNAAAVPLDASAGSVEDADFIAGKAPEAYMRKYGEKRYLNSAPKPEKVTGTITTTDASPAGDGTPIPPAGSTGDAAQEWADMHAAAPKPVTWDKNK